MDMKEEYRAIFAEESAEHLQEWEAALLALEQNPEDQELVHTMFRSIHTLKGSAGFIGFEKLQRLAHETESALQEIRDGTARLKSSSIEVLFRALDLARDMVECFTQGKEFDGDIEGFLQELREANPEASHPTSGHRELEPVSPASEQAAPADADAQSVADSETYRGGRKRVELELCVKASGREGFLRAFLVRSRLAGLATILAEDPAPELLIESGGRFVYRITLDTTVEESALRDALNIDLLEITSVKKLVESRTPGEHASSEGGPVAVAAPETTGTAARTDEVVRVSVERLDTLLNLVGELVIQNSGFTSVAQELKEQYGKSSLIDDLEVKTEGLAKITRDLQDGIMKVRMLPVNNVFSRFYRVVRDLAKDRGKEITLSIFGEETEIDKKVMDRIGDPLVHLVRNAIDHGIESRDERLAAGKAPVGMVRVGAYQNGDHICIEVSDDGRGLDRGTILRKAVERALVRAEEADHLSDEQALGLIFLPGFSTARVVTEVSGRGVGMDVVKRAIEGLGGSIRIRSAVGRGTTVTISLPLTMAIIPAVLAEVSDSTLAVPLSSVKEVLKVEEEELRSIGIRPVVRLREEVLALVHLREALKLSGNGSGRSSADSRMPVVVVECEDRKIGLGVDRVLGTREIVIKSLSRHYREVEGLIGASILGNGRIALIVDVEGLVRQHYRTDGAERSLSDQGVFSFEGAVSASVGTIDKKPEPRPSTGAAEIAVAESAADTDGGNTPAPEEPSAPVLPVELATRRRMVLEEIHNTGAIQASMALSRMTGQEIRVSFPESRLVSLAVIAEILGGEEQPIGGIYVGLGGELIGGTLIVLPAWNLLRFHDFLYHKPAGTCASLEEVDLSGISELGNILSASFINSISDQTGLSIKSDTPEISVDMCLAVIDSVLSRFNQPGEQLLLTKALVFDSDSEEVTCHLLMFLELESFTKLLDVLTAGPERTEPGE